MNLHRKMNRCCVSSLFNLSIEVVGDSLIKYILHDKNVLISLPNHIKNHLLKRRLLSHIIHDTNYFKEVFSILLTDNVESINLTNYTVDDDVLRILIKAKKLVRLYLTATSSPVFTIQGLMQLLPHLKQLEILDIPHFHSCTDDVLVCIASNCPLLTYLDVGGCRLVTDSGVKSLTRLKHFHGVNLSQSQITNKGLEEALKTDFGKNLKELRINNCKHITNKALLSIAENCPKMEVLIYDNVLSNDENHFEQLPTDFLKKMKQFTFTVRY